MTEQLVTCDTARQAREKGFDEEVRALFEWYEYNGKVYGPTEIQVATAPEGIGFAPEEREIMAEVITTMATLQRVFKAHNRNSSLPPWLFARPTQDLLERWLREVHGLIAQALPLFSAHGYADHWEASIKSKTTVIVTAGGRRFESYEDAREDALMLGLMLIP